MKLEGGLNKSSDSGTQSGDSLAKNFPFPRCPEEVSDAINVFLPARRKTTVAVDSLRHDTNWPDAYTYAFLAKFLGKKFSTTRSYLENLKQSATTNRLVRAALFESETSPFHIRMRLARNGKYMRQARRETPRGSEPIEPNSGAVTWRCTMKFFLSIDFMPHGYCYLWKPGLIWLHAVSDSLIALAYFSISVTLIYFIRKRRDLAFNWMFVSFGMFILACGTTHIMEVWTLWHGTYWLSGAVKAVTAMASVPTAILLVHLVPRALALPSAEAMKLEIAERERAQEALHRTKDELELRVLERTAELRRANEELVAEIAQRKQAEDALRKRERLIHAILDNSPALIFLKDREGRYLLINKEFEETFGVTQEEIRGKKDEQVFPAEHATAFRANDLRVIQTGVPAEFEEVALQDDGPHKSLVHKFPLLDAEGKIYAIGGIATDITERKRAEKESVALKDELATELVAMARLHEFSTRLLSKAELTELLEEALRGTNVLQNADFGNVQLYNPETKTLEIVAHRGFQQNFLDYFSSVSETGAACGRSLQRRDRVIIEDVLADPDFKPHRQIAASAGFRAVQSTPLFSRSGEPLGMISTHFRQPHRPSERELRFTDLYARLVAELIERQRAEAALRASEERFRHMVEGIKDYAIYMLDLDGRVIAWNVGAERMKNYSSKEILGRHFSRFYEPLDAELGKPERALKEAAVAGRFEEEGWRVRKDGSRFWANVIMTAVKDEAGKLQGFVKVSQ